MNRNILIGLALLTVVLISACTTAKTSETDADTESDSDNDLLVASWQQVELKDVNTGETFTIESFSGKPVVLETFAVWCPTCTKQQKILKEFHKEVGDSIISISLDVDPNEDESKIKAHAESNGFDWKYAIAPATMTKQLIEEFGTGIVNAPSSPIIIICADQTYHKVSANGLKSVDKLKEELATCT